MPESDPSSRASPLFFTTFFRPDVERPHAQLELVALDMRRLELFMEAGYEDPRPKTGLPGRGSLPDDPELIRRVKATFNGAFKSLHGEYGMVVERRTLVPPVDGVATVAVTESNETWFGEWPPPPELAARIVSLRQNMSPLIADAVVNPGGQTDWGDHSLADGVFTERSALCLGHDGHVYYAWGDGLSGTTLARGLERAGCRFAMHLDMNPGHCGFFFHDSRDGQLETIRAEPAFAGIEMAPTRFARSSSKDFFYVALRDQGLSDWLPDPGAQPEPEWLPAITSTRRVVGSFSVDVTRFAAGRIAYTLLAGSDEPLLEGRVAPQRTLDATRAPLFALNLGHTTLSSRFGLATQPEASLPLRRANASLLLDGSELSVVPEGQAVELQDGQLAVQLPTLMRDHRLDPRAREPGALRQRAALCVDERGAVFVASVRHDSSDVLALALRELGCGDALELDRGSQHEAFLHRAGTPQAPRRAYSTTMLVGLEMPLAPRAFEW